MVGDNGEVSWEPKKEYEPKRMDRVEELEG
jgi:hypothetical protein